MFLLKKKYNVNIKMDNIKVIHVENFDINKKFVVSVNCKINYKLYSTENLQNLFKTQVNDVINNG